MQAVQFSIQKEPGIHRIDDLFNLCESGLMREFWNKYGNPAEWSSEVLDLFITQWETLPSNQYLQL